MNHTLGEAELDAYMKVVRANGVVEPVPILDDEDIATALLLLDLL